jgi:hypothetical protein
VVDAATEIVQMYDSDGQILMHFGGPGIVPGALVLPAAVAVDTSAIPYFKRYIHTDFDVKYLLFVTSQYGEHLLSVYAFGAFPEGFQPSAARIATLPPAGGQKNEDSTPSAPNADNTTVSPSDRRTPNR